MPHPQGHDCTTHAHPQTNPEDMPAVLPPVNTPLHIMYLKLWVLTLCLQHSPLGGQALIVTLTSPPYPCSPRATTSLACFGPGRGFVRMSVGMLAVCRYLNSTSGDCTLSWMKWYWISMCLVWAWKDRSLVRVMDLELSFQIHVVSWGCPRSSISLHSHSTSLVAWQLTMYSALHVDMETVAWCLELQEIAPLPSEKMNPEVDHWVSRQPEKSVLTHPVNVTGHVPPKTTTVFLVASRYQMTLCTVVQCPTPGSLPNWLNQFVAYVISGQVAMDAYIRELTPAR